LLKTATGENALELGAHVGRARLHCIVCVTRLAATRRTVRHSSPTHAPGTAPAIAANRPPVLYVPNLEA
jgi:hypothetical protein